MGSGCALKETASYLITKHGEAPSNEILETNEAEENRRTAIIEVLSLVPLS